GQVESPASAGLSRCGRGLSTGPVGPVDLFSAATPNLCRQTVDGATPAQELGWPKIASGAHTLIQAPTGSGKTLAAFLYGLDRLLQEQGEGTRLVYVSPLKALNYDIERNLRRPLAGLHADLKVAVRTGDTPQKERAAMLRHPPDLLITTPESLFLMLTSRARETLTGVHTLILDEVHAVAGTKRGAHLALTVERLERLTEEPFQRIRLPPASPSRASAPPRRSARGRRSGSSSPAAARSSSSTRAAPRSST